MKQLFAIGQAVTPDTRPSWMAKSSDHPGRKAGDKMVGPKFGDVVHVSAFKDHNGMGYIQFSEHPPINGERFWFQQTNFVPVVSDSVLSKELEEIFQEDLVESK